MPAVKEDQDYQDWKNQIPGRYALAKDFLSPPIHLKMYRAFFPAGNNYLPAPHKQAEQSSVHCLEICAGKNIQLSSFSY